jgi:hypothetical protein
MSITWFNRAHPRAAVLLAQDSYIAGLSGDVYENHWHQYNTLDACGAPRVSTMCAARSTLERALPDRAQAHVSQYARPLALRLLLDQCTIAEYAFSEFYVARGGAGVPCRGG